MVDSACPLSLPSAAVEPVIALQLILGVILDKLDIPSSKDAYPFILPYSTTYSI
jgi:hypothetical protein